MVLDLLTDLMGVVPTGVDYAEARHVDQLTEVVAVRNGAVDRVESDASAGIGVRVRAGGAWGFAATDDATPAGARRALGRAIAAAGAQPRTRPPAAAPPPRRAPRRGGPRRWRPSRRRAGTGRRRASRTRSRSRSTTSSRTCSPP